MVDVTSGGFESEFAFDSFTYGFDKCAGKTKEKKILIIYFLLSLLS